MIGVDWGTSNFRAWRLTPDGAIVEKRIAPLGILQIAQGDFAGDFAAALEAEIGEWLRDGEERVILCGMIGSRQGWQEVPYVRCPAGIAELADAVATVPFAAARVRLVPGVSAEDGQGVPDVIRGEETKIVGLAHSLGANALVALPGTHSKWVRFRDGRISAFSTHMSGEVFGVLSAHSILGRMMRPKLTDGGPTDWAAFERGLARAADPGGLLHHLFGVRALGLAGLLDEAGAGFYLSGVLIGHEVRAALSGPEVVHLIGEPRLTGQYARAITAAGGTVRLEDEDAAAHGLAAIGARVDWRASPG